MFTVATEGTVSGTITYNASSLFKKNGESLEELGYLIVNIEDGEWTVNLVEGLGANSNGNESGQA